MWQREGFCSVLRWKSLEGVDMLMERRPSRGGSAEDPGEIGGPWLEVGKKMGRGEVGGGEGEGGGPGGGVNWRRGEGQGKLINLYANVHGCTYR